MRASLEIRAAAAAREMSMKYGIAIRSMGPPATRTTIRACAETAERMGFDALVMSDHLCIPPDQTEGSGGRYLDVLTTLAYLAGTTTRIRIGVSVLILPYRPPVLTAKQIATIQELSGDRMILGVGVGWLRGEFEALGVDMEKRGALMDEALRVIRHLFDHPEPTPYRGPLVSFPAFVFEPHPVRPPIWIGGSGANAMRRVIEFGDGWHPRLHTAELKPLVEQLRTRMRAAGRPDPEIIARSVLPLDDLAAARAKFEAKRAAGVTYFILDLGRYTDANEFTRLAEKFMASVAR